MYVGRRVKFGPKLGFLSILYLHSNRGYVHVEPSYLIKYAQDMLSFHSNATVILIIEKYDIFTINGRGMG